MYQIKSKILDFYVVGLSPGSQRLAVVALRRPSKVTPDTIHRSGQHSGSTQAAPPLPPGDLGSIEWEDAR